MPAIRQASAMSGQGRWHWPAGLIFNLQEVKCESGRTEESM